MPAIKGHRVTNTMHPLGTTTACSNFQGNPFNSCAASMAMIKSRGGECRDNNQDLNMKGVLEISSAASYIHQKVVKY